MVRLDKRNSTCRPYSDPRAGPVRRTLSRPPGWPLTNPVGPDSPRRRSGFGAQEAVEPTNRM